MTKIQKKKTLKKNHQSGGFLNFFSSKKSPPKSPTKKIQPEKPKKYAEYQKVYLRLIQYPQVGWLLLPPRNQMKETQQHLQMAYSHPNFRQHTVEVIKDMFMGMRDKSPKKLIDKYVENLQIDVPYVVVKFKYHPETDVMEYVEEII